MRTAHDSTGFTLVELLIVVAIIGIVAAIATPGLLRARMAGDEASAIGSLRAINSGEAAYSSTCGNGGYAATLEDLFAAPTGSTGFISPDLNATAVIKNGFVVTVEAGSTAITVAPVTVTCNGTASTSSYYAKAEPFTFNGTGTRAFATDTRGTIFQKTNSGTADTNPIPATALPVQ